MVICELITQLCPILCDPMDCSLVSSDGFLQARILEWVAISSPEDLPDPGIEPRSPALQADALPSEPPGKSSVSIEADGKRLCCSVIGNALGKCQFVVDNSNSMDHNSLKSL